MTASLCCEVCGGVCGVGGDVVCGCVWRAHKITCTQEANTYMYTARFYTTIHVDVKSADSALTVRKCLVCFEQQ